MLSHLTRSDSGFTLPEVMVAFAILAISLGVLFSAVGTAVGARERIGARSMALRIAQNELALLEIRQDWTPGTYSSFTVDGGFGVVLSIEPLAQDDTVTVRHSYVSVNEVKVEVSWGEEQSIDLRTLRVVW